MSKCDRCPVRDGRCVGESATADAWGWVCRAAARGEESDAIRAASGASPPVDQVAGAGKAIPAPEYPPLATQARNLAGAAVRFVASGFATVDQAEYDRRRAICEGCPSGLYDAAQDRCTVCACYVSVKPWSRSEKCPKGHW